MRLSDIAGLIAHSGGLDIRRDAAFDHLATLDLVQLRRATAVWDATALDAAVADPMVAALILPPQIADRAPAEKGLAVAEDPRRAFLAAHQALYAAWRARPKPKTVIAASARISPHASIAEEAVEIGENAVVEEFASVRTGVRIGEGARIGAGSIIGGEGFDRKIVDGALFIPGHYGGVRIDAGAVIQHNACVDRGTFGNDTVIGPDAALDNLVYVAHNAVIGARVALCGGACVLGASRLGDDVWVGPNATVSSGLTVGAGARVSIGAVVTREVAEGAVVSGNFAIDHEKHLAELRRIR